MNGTENNDSLFLGQTDNLLHNIGSRRGIQTRSRFIEEQKSRLLQESNTNRETTPLASTQARVTGIGTAVEAHFVNYFVANGIDIVLGGHFVKLGSVTKSFAARKVGPMFVVLNDNVAMFLEDLVANGNTVERDRASGPAVKGIERQRTNQSRLVFDIFVCLFGKRMK
jgi:hypothetical protein